MSRTLRGDQEVLIRPPRVVPPSGLEALRIRAYRLLWIGSAVFDAVSVLQNVALVWIVFSLTGSATWVSLMVSASVLPTLLVSVPAGTLADAMSRRLLLLIATILVLVPSAALFVIWVMGIATAPTVVGLGLVRGIGIGLFGPAWSALFPFIVPRRLLSGALALLTASAGVAMVIGAYLGGLIADLDPRWGLGAAVVGYALMAYILVIIRVDEGSFVRTPFMVATRMGLRHVRYSYATYRILAFGGAFGFLSAAIRSVLPNLVDESFGGSAELYGILLAAFGLGLFIGGSLRELVDHLLSGRIIAWSCAGFGVAGVLAATATRPVYAVVGLFLSGLTWTWALSTLGIRFIMMTPGWVRARALGVYYLVVFGLFGLGGVVAGIASDRFGVRVSVLALSLLTVVAALVAVGLPSPEQVDDEEDDLRAPGSDSASPDGPVLVIHRWPVGADRMGEFNRVLAALRAVRLRTGASDWRSFLDPADDGTVVEHFRLHSASESARLPQRYDRDDHDVLRRAEAFLFGPPSREVMFEVVPISERSYVAIPPGSSRVIVPR
jgi:MFS family permease